MDIARGENTAEERPGGGLDRIARGITFWSLFLFGLFLLFVALWIPAEKQYHDLGRSERRLRRDIRRLRGENRNLEIELRALRSDRYFIERLLRERQGLSGQGELVVKSRLRIIPGE
jgi:hypothetical protein